MSYNFCSSCLLTVPFYYFRFVNQLVQLSLRIWPTASLDFSVLPVSLYLRMHFAVCEYNVSFKIVFRTLIVNVCIFLNAI